MRRSTFRALTLVVAGLLVAVAAVYQWGYSAYRAPGPAAADVTVVLPKGLSLDAIARRLAEAGTIARSAVFVWGARLEGKARLLKAGEYRIPAGASMREVVALLVEGRTVVRRLTVPEGLTAIEIVELVHATEGLVGALDRVPEEGSLLPETYHFAFGDERTQMIERMRRGMTQLLAELWPQRQADLRLRSERDAVVLASIVERETPLAAERPRVAAVLINRLNRGMPLQADPTVIYAVSGGRGSLARALTRADLEIESPFNTYRAKGLPPGPIANPGRASIAAVLHPAVSDELYFVADGLGGHAFARTLAEHQKNVARWRKLGTEAGK
jgi:UPF0755 protein